MIERFFSRETKSLAGPGGDNFRDRLKSILKFGAVGLGIAILLTAAF